MIQKITPNCHPRDLNRLTSLFDQKIQYRILGQLRTITVPANNLGWQMIQQLLEDKLIPIILQSQQRILSEIIARLVTLPFVLINLIYEYYNIIPFVRIETIAVKYLSTHAFRLFYQPLLVSPHSKNPMTILQSVMLPLG
jgi:hypothetical protein